MDQSTIRTFRGANAREALAAAKAALGPEAIVIHAREVPGRLFHKPQFEVMAALDDRALEKVAREKAAKEAERTRAEAAARPARDARSQRDDGLDHHDTDHEDGAHRKRRQKFFVGEEVHEVAQADELHLAQNAGLEETEEKQVENGVKDEQADHEKGRSQKEVGLPARFSPGTMVVHLTSVRDRMIPDRLLCVSGYWRARSIFATAVATLLSTS